MLKFTAIYGHDDSGTPGRLTINAESEAEAMRQAAAFVADGYRSETWINLDLGDRQATYKNEHGRAVARGVCYY